VKEDTIRKNVEAIDEREKIAKRIKCKSKRKSL
jgi:hypothetical protein